MKNSTRSLIISIFLGIILYFGTAFVMMELDPRLWDVFTRLLFAVMWIVVSVLTFAAVPSFYEKQETFDERD
jgi:hypothetical protein